MLPLVCSSRTTGYTLFCFFFSIQKRRSIYTSKKNTLQCYIKTHFLKSVFKVMDCTGLKRKISSKRSQQVRIQSLSIPNPFILWGGTLKLLELLWDVQAAAGTDFIWDLSSFPLYLGSAVSLSLNIPDPSLNVQHPLMNTFLPIKGLWIFYSHFFGLALR